MTMSAVYLFHEKKVGKNLAPRLCVIFTLGKQAGVRGQTDPREPSAPPVES